MYIYSLTTYYESSIEEQAKNVALNKKKIHLCNVSGLLKASCQLLANKSRCCEPGKYRLRVGSR